MSKTLGKCYSPSLEFLLIRTWDISKVTNCVLDLFWKGIR